LIHEPSDPLRTDACRHFARTVLSARLAARRRHARDEALIGAIGASDLLQVDGVGGGSTLTSKVAIVSKSSQPGCDVDYLFAQVGVGQKSVDTRPNCGNMLSGVAPFAISTALGAGSSAGRRGPRIANRRCRSCAMTRSPTSRRSDWSAIHRL
jgi:2-methylaconitate cis-trans-isomerase PrpF